MKVFVVIQGYPYEGSNVVSIHRTLRGAFKAVRDGIANNLWDEVHWKYVGHLTWECRHMDFSICRMEMSE